MDMKNLYKLKPKLQNLRLNSLNFIKELDLLKIISRLNMIKILHLGS